MIDSATNTRAVLLDIEGTVAPISFVHDVLFPFARDHVRDYLVQHSTAPEVREDIAALVREYRLDQATGQQLPPLESAESIDAIVAYVNWLISRDRKSPALKSLQGKIWEQGYRDGTLKAPLFNDVVPNLRRLRRHGLKIAIFSSGSVYAQRLLFAHAETGDYTDLIDDYFDTGVGSKLRPSSYREIATRLDLLPTEMVFVSDMTSELKAAREVRMLPLLCVRPGNLPQSDSDQFPVVRSFSEILPTI
jgi:enolase-phosphatase E1